MNPLQLFNPSNLSEQDLTRNFSIRIKEFERIFDKIKADTMQSVPQHFIIQGVRGGGKTTLLLRVYYEIKSDASLNEWLIPIIFSEEQYSVNKLFKFWEQIAKELEYEQVKYSGLLGKMQESDASGQYEEHCHDVLFAALKKNENKICVFIDNIGDFLNKLTKREQQRLREVLISNNQVRIVGASSEALEATFKYDEPFYEYFKIIQLKELNQAETQKFLIALDRVCGTDKIADIIEHHPGRIEALRILTGGVPRTLVLIYELFVNDDNGDSFKQLELLLDRVTPLYKHRMDDLSSQQQEIIDCLAMNWDATTVKDIARITRMESKAVSAQLNLLERNNVVIKKQTSTKNHLYQVKERFFNIWYLMRNGRKSDKNKVLWLTKFLEMWCDKDSIINMAEMHIDKLKSGAVYDKYAYNLSEAFACLIPSENVQPTLLTETKRYLDSIQSDLSDQLSDSDLYFIYNEIEPLIETKKYSEALTKLSKRNSNTGVHKLFTALIYELNEDYEQAEQYYLLAIEKGNKEACLHIAFLYADKLPNYEKAENYYIQSIELGSIDALMGIATLYFTKFGDFDKAEKYLLLAIETGQLEAMLLIAFIYHQKNINKEKALQIAKNAYAIDNSDIKSAYIYSFVLLWNNDIDTALTVADWITQNETDFETHFQNFEYLLCMLLAKQQYNYVYKLFEANHFQIKDRFKPIYYALMRFIADKYPDEIKRMGEELTEVVESVVKTVLDLREKYK